MLHVSDTTVFGFRFNIAHFQITSNAWCCASAMKHVLCQYFPLRELRATFFKISSDTVLGRVKPARCLTRKSVECGTSHTSVSQHPSSRPDQSFSRLAEYSFQDGLALKNFFTPLVDLVCNLHRKSYLFVWYAAYQRLLRTTRKL